MGFEAGESRPVEPSTELEHAERAGDERKVFLCGDVECFGLRLFAAHKDDRSDLSNLGSANHLGVGQTGQQDCLGLAGSKYIAHEICSAPPADLDIKVYFRIKNLPIDQFDNFT